MISGDCQHQHKPTKMAGAGWMQDTFPSMGHHSLIHSNLSLHQVSSSSSAAEEILVRGADEIGDLGWLRYVSHFGAGLP